MRRLWLDDGKSGAGWVYLYHADEVVEEVIQQREKELGQQDVPLPNNDVGVAVPAEETAAADEVSTQTLVDAPTLNGQSEQPTLVKDVVVPVVQEVAAAAA